MIRTLNEKYGTTIFITSHDISDIEKLCSRIILINHGKVMLDSKLEDIKHSFLTKKIIEATYEEQIKEGEINKLIDEHNLAVTLGEKVKIEYDETKIQTGELIQKLMTLGSIQDLGISNTSLENVIYDIYTSTKGESSS